MNSQSIVPTQQINPGASSQHAPFSVNTALAEGNRAQNPQVVIRPVSSVSGRRLRLLTDFARLTSGRYAAIQIEAEPGQRLFVVATDAETERGWIVDDGRERFEGLHPAFDVAHRLASRERHEERLRHEALLATECVGQVAAA